MWTLVEASAVSDSSCLEKWSVWGSEIRRKWIGKVSGGGVKRGMILDPSRSGFGVENGGPGGFKSEQKSEQKKVPKMNAFRDLPEDKLD